MRESDFHALIASSDVDGERPPKTRNRKSRQFVLWKLFQVISGFLEYFWPNQGQDSWQHPYTQTWAKNTPLLENGTPYAWIHITSLNTAKVFLKLHVILFNMQSYLSPFQRYSLDIDCNKYFSFSPLPLLWWMPPCFSWLPKQS